MEFEPPFGGGIVSGRDPDIPTEELAVQVVGWGNRTMQRIDKFETFGLTPAPATLASAPLVASARPTWNAAWSKRGC